MWKISVQGMSDAEVFLKLEGQLTRALAEEIRRAARAYAGRSRTFDLSDVSFVDRDGIALLREWRRSGAMLVRCSAFLIEQLRAAGALDECDCR